MHVAEFESTRVRLTGSASYAQLLIALPRVDEASPEWQKRLEQAHLHQDHITSIDTSFVANPASQLTATSRVELEAERCAFVESLKHRINASTTIIPSVSRSDSRSASGPAGVRAGSPSTDGLHTGLMVSEFVCNVGSIVRGLSRTKKFRVTNASVRAQHIYCIMLFILRSTLSSCSTFSLQLAPLSLDLNAKLLLRCPAFAMEPMRVCVLD